MARPPEQINPGFSDAEGVNNANVDTYIYKDLSLFFTPNPVSGDVTMVTDVQDIKRSVRNLVMTNRFEKPFHPEVASHVRDLLFEPFSPVTINLLRNRIETVLTNYEPRVTLTDVQVEDPEFRLMDNNTLNVRIFFTLKNDPEIQTVDVLLERLR
jgi:phage baseplate assembly protein W